MFEAEDLKWKRSENRKYKMNSVAKSYVANNRLIGAAAAAAGATAATAAAVASDLAIGCNEVATK
jgi:hypothetical protein